MNKEQILELAKAESTKVVDYDLLGNPITDADVLLMNAYGPLVIRIVNAAISSYKAELLKEVGEPVAARRKVAMWQGGDDYKYEWAVVKEHTTGTEPLYTSDQVAAAIIKATGPMNKTITSLRSELDSRMATDTHCVKQQESITELRTKLAAAQKELNQCSGLLDDSLRSIEMLEDQLAKAEQRVAEACALQVATEIKFHWLDAARVAKEIRSGDWRKFVKEN